MLPANALFLVLLCMNDRLLEGGLTEIAAVCQIRGLEVHLKAM